MTKPKNMEEYDGYVIPKPHQLTKAEREEAERKIKELRKKAIQANSKSVAKKVKPYV